MSDEWRILSEKYKVDDAGIKNQFSWKWFEDELFGQKVSSWCRKVAKSGFCVCIMCNKAKINYSTSGKNALKKSRLDRKASKSKNSSAE